MEYNKQEEKYSWKEAHSFSTPQGDNGENFRDPHHRHDQKGQERIASIKFNEKKHHPQHDWDEYQIFQNMCGNQETEGPLLAHMCLELQGEFQHALLRRS
jgi:hypothetical protein